jgi:hypothetical protein
MSVISSGDTRQQRGSKGGRGRQQILPDRRGWTEQGAFAMMCDCSTLKKTRARFQILTIAK